MCCATEHFFDDNMCCATEHFFDDNMCCATDHFFGDTMFLTLSTFGPYGKDTTGGISAHDSDRYHPCAGHKQKLDTLSVGVLFLRRVLKLVALSPFNRLSLRRSVLLSK